MVFAPSLVSGQFTVTAALSSGLFAPGSVVSSSPCSVAVNATSATLTLKEMYYIEVEDTVQLNYGFVGASHPGAARYQR
jgi:hypothetical protein